MKCCFNCKKLPTKRVDNEEPEYPFVVEHDDPTCPFGLIIYRKTMKQAVSAWDEWITNKGYITKPLQLHRTNIPSVEHKQVYYTQWTRFEDELPPDNCMILVRVRGIEHCKLVTMFEDRGYIQDDGILLPVDQLTHWHLITPPGEE